MNKTYKDNEEFGKGTDKQADDWSKIKCKYMQYECDDYVMVYCKHKKPPKSGKCIGGKCTRKKK